MRTLACLLVVAAACGSENLLRNGGFECQLKYWCGERVHPDQRVVETDAAEGRFALRIDKGYLWSGPFRISPSAHVTLSASARAIGDGAHCHFFLTPASRQAGVEPFKQFWGKSGWGSAVADKTWKRLSWDIEIPGPQFAWGDVQWWDRQTWMLYACGDHVELDAISVTLDGGGKDAFVAHAPVEVGVIAALPGFDHGCNLLDPAKPVDLTTWLSNPSDGVRTLSVHWQVLDYAGERVFAELAEQRVALKPHETISLATRAPLAGKGLMLARATVSEDGKRIASSDQPLTVLPFPRGSAKPDPRERFGGSVVTGEEDPAVLEPLHRCGFAWSRWFPQSDWNAVQPDGADQWRFPDAAMDALERHGFCFAADLYAPPKWAQGGRSNLPKDMDWAADDPRWKDLTQMTAWDRYVDAMVKRYAKRAIAWEVANEPLFAHWDPAIYTRLIERTYRRIKAIDPQATVQVNGCYGVDDLHRHFLELGGAAWCDSFTFHNYGASGWFSSGDAVGAMHDAFRTAGHDRPVWFNEGWTHWPSSEDYPCASVFADRTPAGVAHESVCAIADAFAGGMDKLILFELLYADHGRSWWDWSGDGTELWDEQHQPTVAVAAFNVASDRLGLSSHVASVRAEKAVLHVFQDERHHRGVLVAWATEAPCELTLPIAKLERTDIVGNGEVLASSGGKTVVRFAQAGRPWYFSADGVDGAALAKAVRPLAKPDVEIGPGAYALPDDWAKLGKDGNPYRLRGQPIWRLGRLYPPEIEKPENFRTFGDWVPAEAKWTQFAESQGGNPAANLQGGVRITVATEWQSGDRIKPSTLSFIAPKAARYELDAVARSERWTGGGQCWLRIVARDLKAGTAREVARISLDDRKDAPVATPPVELRAGDELVLVYGADGWNTGAGCKFPKLVVRAVLGGTDQNRPVK